MTQGSRLMANMKASEMTRRETTMESGRNDPEGNEKIGETARISHCRSKTMNISPGIEVTRKQTQHKNEGK